jgi:hypothetical protein
MALMSYTGDVVVPLTTPTSVANMDGAEHDFWPVISEFDTDARQRFGAPHRWARSSALTALAGAPAFV